MDLKKLQRQKIIDEILNCYNFAWSFLIHDQISMNLLSSLFHKSDLIDYGVTGLFSVGDKNKKWDVPAIYFLNCTKEISRVINEDYKSNKYSDFRVFSICEPVGLDPMIKVKVVNVNIKIVEERIFKCDIHDLPSLSNILNGKFIISYANPSQKFAESINRICKYESSEGLKNIFFLALDRTIDLVTPILHSLTFRSVLNELENTDLKDGYYKQLRDLNLSEVVDHLNYTIKTLCEKSQKLNDSKLDIDFMSSMVTEIPKDEELKNNVAKHLEYLTRSKEYYESVKDQILKEQMLATGEDKNGSKVQITLDSCLSFILSPSVSNTNKNALILLLKLRGISFTESEIQMLKAKGFSNDYLSLRFQRNNQIIVQKKDIKNAPLIKFTPILSDVVESFATKKQVFQTLNIADTTIDSLRKSRMINTVKPPRKVIVVYMKGGLCTEELTHAYKLSMKLGYEFIFGSDRILTRKQFIEDYKVNPDFWEPNVK